MAARLPRVGVVIAELASPAIADATLTPAQLRLVELLTYGQVARDRCRFLIDVDLLRLAARRAGIDCQTRAEERARDDGFATAERAFSGRRERVECAYALQRYGPDGTKFPGLLERRPE